MEIRLAKEKDMPQITDLCLKHAKYEGVTQNLNITSEHLQNFIFSENPPIKCLVVEQERDIVGYATFMSQFSTWDAAFYIYLDCLFLEENSRGNGIGKKLIERIKVEAKKNNCNTIQWQTPQSNVQAIRFYRSIGAVSKSKKRFFLTL